MTALWPHVSELIVGFILVVFGFAFRAWAGTVRAGTDKILGRLDLMAKEIHQHRIESERRMVRMETEIKVLLHDKDRRDGPTKGRLVGRDE